MYLFAQTLQRSSAITSAIIGSFSAPKIQEIVVARGKVLELLRPDDQTGSVVSICQTEVFGVIRSLAPFRFVGGNRDFIIVGSDSGRIVILQFSPEKNRFIKIHEETYGKSGCRRIVPGQYLAVDPNGRAAMIGAIEKQKFVYVLNRDAQANLTISSPLEAHKSHAIHFSMVGVDVGLDNPVFACLEVDYEAKDGEEKSTLEGRSKQLVYYELDLGLNHVTRKWADRVDDTANLLVTVPGGTDGPGGVLVCAENAIYYKDQDSKTLRCPIPRRYGLPDDRGVLLTSVATHKQKKMFFFLAQSEFGDLYKITLEYQKGGDDDDEYEVSDLTIKYFDSIPSSTSLLVLKTGFMFAAAEFGNHFLFEFVGLGDDEAKAVASASTSEGMEPTDYIFFQPRKLTNLRLVEEMESLAPITDMKVDDATLEGTPQIYTLCGRGPRSSLRVLRHGLPVTEIAASELPGTPTGVWAVKKNAADPYASYIVVSFVNATIVLSIGETVVEVSDSGLLDSTSTLSVSLLGENSLLQVHPNGLRHVRADKRINEWKVPGKKTVVQCAANSRQVVLALTGGEIVYFELDKMGNLLDIHRRDLGSEVACLSLPPVPEGRLRAPFVAVGTYENIVRVLSLDPANPLAPMTNQALTAPPHSLLLTPMAGGAVDDGSGSTLYLYSGLSNGLLVRSQLDETTGQLLDTRRRVVGTKPVKLFAASVQGRPAAVAISSRTWLAYTYQNKLNLTPLSYDPLDYASAFSSEQCPEGLVTLVDNSLRITAVERLGQVFNQTVVPLRYTPRKLYVHQPPSGNKLLIVLETDQNAFPEKVKRELLDNLKQALVEDGEPSVKQEGSSEMDTGEEHKGESKTSSSSEEDPTELMAGVPQAGLGKWASCVRIFDPVQGETTFLLEFEDNEAAFSATVVEFKSEPGVTYLAVGTAKDLMLAPRALTSGFIRIYKFSDDHKQLELVHKTPVDDVVMALAPFKGRLLAGVGKSLRMYELGKRKLLKKCENKSFPTGVATITVHVDRIYVGDLCESFHYCAYKQDTNTLAIFADSLTPRHVTAAAQLDYDTMAGADKFGNVFVSRLPGDVSARIQKDPTGGHVFSVYGEGGERAKQVQHKLDDVVNFHVGETITAMCKTSLVPGGQQVILYATILGGIGMLAPLGSKEEVEFYSHLEMHLRSENPPLCGRDHMAFRSYYFPVKDCVDGDLCEQFAGLDADKQKTIADELTTRPADISKKLEELRNRVL